MRTQRRILVSMQWYIKRYRLGQSDIEQSENIKPEALAIVEELQPSVS